MIRIIVCFMLVSFSLISEPSYCQEEKIYDFPDKDASYPGGVEAMYKYLYGRITYPKQAISSGIQGRLFIEFVVSETGQVTNVKLLQGIGGGCDEEALAAVRSMPDWSPAFQADRNVQQRVKLPIVFELEDKKDDPPLTRKDQRQLRRYHRKHGDF